MKDFEILNRDTVVAAWNDIELKVLNNDLLMKNHVLYIWIE